MITARCVRFSASRAVLCLVLAVVSYFLCVQRGLSQESASAAVFGSCNLVQQNLKFEAGSTVNTIVECGNKSLEDSFRVRYLWLDQTASSFLIAGHFDSSLIQLVGSRPVVLKNEPYYQLDEIVKKFGFPVSRANDEIQKGTQYTLSTKGAQASIVSKGVDDIPLSILRKMKVYAGSEKIIWPDKAATQSVIGTDFWPKDYAMTYRELESFNYRKDKTHADNMVISCVILHRAITRTQLSNYWTEMEAVESAILSKEFKEQHIKNQAFTNDFKLSSLDNQSIEAMLHFGKDYWPDDFLIGIGNADADECGAGSFGFYAVPRRLFTLVAVIEATSSTLEIESVLFSVNEETKLRALKDGTIDARSPDGVISLRRGGSVMIPLRVELRYDLESEPFDILANRSVSEQSWRRISGLPADRFKLTLQDADAENTQVESTQPKMHVFFEKAKSAFLNPQLRKVTRSFVFGKTYSIKSINLKGKQFPVRPAPASALVFDGVTGEGSCPFLFVSEEGGAPALVGRVLIGASNAQRVKMEEIILPQGSSAFWLSEQEPEITIIRRIVLSAEDLEDIVLGEDIFIRPGKVVKWDIPERYRSSPRIKITGYYIPLNSEGIHTASVPH